LIKPARRLYQRVGLM